MQITCPYCGHSPKVKEIPPGGYTPRCPKCARKFKLVIPEPIIEVLSENAGEPGASANAIAASKPAAAAKANGASKQQAAQPSPVGAPQTHETTAFVPSAASAATGERRPQKKTRDDQAAPTVAKSKDDKKKRGLPDTLDGYQLLKELGKGGMGTVLLARQVSLDRPVALKVMNERCASDPRFLGRFTREAYAAAQLVHHNVVQIYDIGEDKGIHFFSMEYVKGQNLFALVHEHGKLDPEVAVGYALQAARGLKFAHDLGMIHRDVKPENLLVNDQQIVKVADLGLVKIGLDTQQETPAGTNSLAGKSGPSSAAASGTLSIAGSVIGTPAYMSPEQGRGENIDGRADIYSLGCTLYVMLTGRQPFEGKTLKQMLTQHASAPIVPPDKVTPHVTPVLSGLLLRMMAKKPDDRFRDMGEVVEHFEEYLGVRTAGPFTPRAEQADQLENCVKQFNAAAMAKVRWIVMVAFAGLCPILMLGSALAGQFALAAAFLGLAVLTPLSAFVFHGIFQGSPIFVKVREWVFASSWRDWLLWAVGFIFLLLILYLIGFVWMFIGTCIVAVALGAGFYFGIDARLFRQREPALVSAEKLFRDLRLRGLDEETLRHFAAKYSGKHWEEFFEALFGYEAKLEAREGLKGESGRARARFGVWREAVVRWLEERVQARRAAREQRHLQKVEEQYLRAEGIEPVEAKRRSARMAEAFVGEAQDLKRHGAAGDRRERMKRLLRAAKTDDDYRDRQPRALAGMVRGVADLAFGAKIRFLAACALIVGCLLWVKQNDLISADLAESATGAISSQGVDLGKLKKVDLGKLQKDVGSSAARATKPLVVPGLPERVTGIIDSANAGIIGMVLLLTCVFWGWRAGLAIWLGVFVALGGAHWGIPGIGPVSAAYVSLAAGTAIAVIGGYLLRRG